MINTLALDDVNDILFPKKSALDGGKVVLCINFLRLGLPSFEVIDLLKTDKFKEVDYIVTKDTFEHSSNLDKILQKFHQILKKDGMVLAGFGPLYNF